MPVAGQLRAGARRYRAVLALPGARGPVVASAAGSMAIGMFNLAILLLAREATGSYAQAGRVVGAFGVANALGAVAQGRLMDRHGQPRVLRAAATGHLLAFAALVIAAGGGASSWVLALCAAAGGACLPQLPAAMRALWGALVADDRRRQTAYALVAIVYELSVVTAPALVAGIVAVVSPGAAVLAAATVASGGALAFAATGASRRWRGAAPVAGWLGPLSAPGMRTVFGCLVTFGAAIGAVQVALPALTDERGSAEAGGLLIAALSAGSLIGGLVYGARTWPGTQAARLSVLLLCLGGGFSLLATTSSIVLIVVLLLASGLLLAPTTVVGSTLLDTAAPPGTVTEAFTVMIMGIVLGVAAGSALGGALVESASYELAVVCAGGVAALGALFARARRRTLGEPVAPRAGSG